LEPEKCELKRTAEEYDQKKTEWDSSGKRFGLLRDLCGIINDSFKNFLLVADTIYPAYRDGVAKWINEGCAYGRYEIGHHYRRLDKRKPKTRLKLLKRAIRSLEYEVICLEMDERMKEPISKELDTMSQEILKLEIG